ncbi:hypothetical protein QL285_056198 [Trifolium repens]|nr:hypothetical protein QL285_056198 [Trifolium repens]
MGSLMAGWGSSSIDPKSATLKRNQSLTKDEIDAYWKSKKKIEEEHLRAISNLSETIQVSKYNDPEKKLQKSMTMPVTHVRDSFNMDALDTSLEQLINKNGWWTGPWNAIPKKKETIWAYVNKRYIVPEKGEKAVYAIINDAWRREKWLIKKNHFTKYKTLRERLKNRPDSIPIAHFKKLMTYWRYETIQEICHQNAKNIAKQKWRHRAGPISFAIIRERLRATKDNREPPTQAEVFIETRQSKRGNQLDQVTSNAITNLQDLITNSGKSSVEVFQTVFGKEKPGRMRCHGRATTSSILKRNKEAEMEKKHAAEVNSLTDKVQEMVAKHEEMEAKHNKEMAAMEGKLHMLLKVMLNQRNSSLDVGDLVGILTTPHNDNNEVNHGCDEHLFDNSEEEEEEHLFDDLEEDEEYIV